LGSTSRGGRIH